MRLAALALVFVAAVARADEGPDDDEEWDEDEVEAPAATPAPTTPLERRLAELEERLVTAEKQAAKPSPVHLSGYIDVGFFAPLGNGGEGVRRDVGHAAFPEHADTAWVFYGDLMATAVNSRGEPADLGELPGADRYDSVDSDGNAAFLLNEANLTVSAAISPRLLGTLSANLTPRRGTDFHLGDLIDVDLAQLEWIPDDRFSFFVGKVDSVLGIEYRTRKASQRFGITPTLTARYTTGTAIGLKARARLLGDHLRLAVALTNGSFGSESFHFHDEQDANSGKTVSARVSVRTRLGSADLEIGVSGQAGAQDGVPDGAGTMWLAGPDLELSTVSFALRAQWLTGRAPGDEAARAYELELHSAGYVETTWQPHTAFGLLARAELRDADVRLGTERLYITRNWRAVLGARVALTPGLTLKAEFLHNGEFGDVPSFNDDVITSSIVAVF